MLVMIGHVREKRLCTNLLYLHQRNFFEHQYYINPVGDVDWVCLALDRKMWKAHLNMVMCLQVV